MNKTNIIASALGAGINFILFLAKLYVGISTNSLSVYCDSINNLGDTFACLIAVIGLALSGKLIERQNKRAQSLCTFVISLIIAVTGAYFVYNGTERIMYPLPVSYSKNYALIIIAAIFVKIAMGVMFCAFYSKNHSPVLKAFITDSFLDCFVTLSALMGLFLVSKLNFAVDGIFAVITGGIITVISIKEIINQAKYLIKE